MWLHWAFPSPVLLLLLATRHVTCSGDRVLRLPGRLPGRWAPPSGLVAAQPRSEHGWQVALAEQLGAEPEELCGPREAARMVEFPLREVDLPFP